MLLDFKLHDATLDFVNFGGQRIDFHAQTSGSFVDEIDCFVGEETIGDVTLGKHGGCEDGRIFDAHAVMYFVTFLQSAQDGDGVFDGRFAHKDGLEAAF